MAGCVESAGARWTEVLSSSGGFQRASHALSQAACKAEPKGRGFHGGGVGSRVMTSSLSEDSAASSARSRNGT